MPTYEYACEHCGHKMEVFQSILAERLVKCPSCSTDGLKRLIGTGAGLIFKGTGFYETDYKSKSGTSDASGTGGDKAAASTPAASESSAKSTPEPSKSASTGTATASS